MAGSAAAHWTPQNFRRLPPQTPPYPPPPTIFHGAVFVDRVKTCPMLIRAFAKVGSHHSMEEFAVRGKEPESEFQIYTWKDATLRELTSLVGQATPEARKRDALLSFAFVFPDRNGRFIMRRVGKTWSYCTRKMDDEKTLAQLGFQTGDFLDVAIF